ncbi:hypothetical protein IC765_19445 (plasmid) [Acinetobacter seifertii]|nr:hypothetical protein IC765_06310 [Acinetobacter seifertii]QNY19030.1 hypothetical protein IC765_19445 [Acinetobacter seifertii]
MDKKSLLEKFKAEVESSNTSLAHIMKICHFDENCNDFGSDTVHDYSIGCLNGAWWMFQRQQAKVEELQKRLENLEKLKDVYRALSDKELDNCTEGLLKHIERLEMLEQALKGEG